MSLLETLSVMDRVVDMKRARDTVMADPTLIPKTKFAIDVLFQEMILNLEQQVVNDRGA
jgi:hypothetical protein